MKMTIAESLSMKHRDSALANAEMRAVYTDFGATRTYEYTLFRFADGSALEAKYRLDDGKFYAVEARPAIAE